MNRLQSYTDRFERACKHVDGAGGLIESIVQDAIEYGWHEGDLENEPPYEDYFHDLADRYLEEEVKHDSHE